MADTNEYLVDRDITDEEDESVNFDSDPETDQNLFSKNKTSKVIKLAATKWHIYVDLQGLTEEQIQKQVFSIPKVRSILVSCR